MNDGRRQPSCVASLLLAVLTGGPAFHCGRPQSSAVGYTREGWLLRLGGQAEPPGGQAMDNGKSGSEDLVRAVFEVEWSGHVEDQVGDRVNSGLELHQHGVVHYAGPSRD